MITNKQYKEDMLILIGLIGDVNGLHNSLMDSVDMDLDKFRAKVLAISDQEPPPQYVPPIVFGPSSEMTREVNKINEMIELGRKEILKKIKDNNETDPRTS